MRGIRLFLFLALTESAVGRFAVAVFVAVVGVLVSPLWALRGAYVGAREWVEMMGDALRSAWAGRW